MGQAASRTQPAPLRAHALARGFALAIWDGDEAARGRDLRIGFGARFRRPCSSCSVRLMPRRVRNLLLVATESADDGKTLAVTGIDGRILATSQQQWQPLTPEFDAAGILTGIDRRDKARLLRFFLETCPAAAAISADPTWIAACQRLIAVLGGHVRALDARCRLVGKWCLYEGRVPAALDGRARAVLITDGGLSRPAATRLSPTAIGNQQRLLHLIVADEIGAATATVVIFAGDGATIRALPSPTLANSPPLLSFLRQGSAAEAEARRHLLYGGLAELSSAEPRAAALLRELRLLLPEATVARRPNAAVPLAGIDHLIASAAGLFIRGWLDISHRPEVIEVECGSERHRLPVAELVTFPFAERSGCAVGFVAGVAVSNPEAPCRIRLNLGSGLSVDLATGPDNLDARQARDRVISSLPASLAADRAIGVIEPVVQALQLVVAITPTSPVAATVIGQLPVDPLVSIIVPLGHAAEPVRCRVAQAAMAADAARCEFIYVLDRPNAFASAERLLSDLWQCCGTGGRLLLMSTASDPASPLNLGAAAARGRYLLFLNSGTVPETADWPDALLSHHAHLSDAGAVAGTLIHPDQSLHQLGGDVGEGAFGRWGPRWHAAGFPRATMVEAEPLLLAAPGLMLAKSCFDRLGGFDPGYFDPRFRDADFSLRLREGGGRLALVRSSLFLEFEDDESPTDTGLETARELDRRLFERRWRVLVDTLRPAAEGRIAGDLARARAPRSANRRAA